MVRPFIARAALVLGACAGLAAGPGVAAIAAPTDGTAPSLTISVDDGEKSARDGEERSYRVVVKNVGATPASNLTVRLAVPANATVKDAKGGETGEGAVRWSVNVDAGKTTEVGAVVEMGPAPKNAKGVAATACVLDGDQPLICASDVNQIPGAEDIHASAPLGSADKADKGNGHRTWIVAVAVVLVFLALLAVVLVRRGRRKDASAISAPGRELSDVTAGTGRRAENGES